MSWLLTTHQIFDCTDIYLIGFHCSLFYLWEMYLYLGRSVWTFYPLCVDFLRSKIPQLHKLQYRCDCHLSLRKRNELLPSMQRTCRNWQGLTCDRVYCTQWWSMIFCMILVFSSFIYSFMKKVMILSENCSSIFRSFYFYF